MKDSNKRVRPQVLSIDSDASNSWEARSNFSIRRPKKIFSMIFTWVLAILVTASFVIFIFLIGLTSSLTCKRDKTGEPVNCAEQTFFYSLIPLNEREIRDVRSAEVTVYTESDTEYYTVELITRAGNFELHASSSADYLSKRMVADKINGFTFSDVANTLEVNDPGRLTMGSVVADFGLPVASVLGVCLFLGLSKSWKGIKSILGRSRYAQPFHVSSGFFKKTKSKHQNMRRYS
jgi:hypothetical protein